VPAEDRPARIAELERQVAREWLRYFITEGVVIFVPLAAFLAVYVLTDAVPDDALIPIVIVIGIPMLPLIAYWMKFRILPLSKELEELKRLEASA